MTKTLLIADDHVLMREGLSSMLKLVPQITLIGAVSDGLEVIEFTKKNKPDIILMDIKMPIMNGIQATYEIRKTNRDVKIICMSMYDDEQTVSEMFYAGINGYLLKSVGLDELKLAINRVCNGDEYYCDEAATVLLSRLTKNNKNLKSAMSRFNFTLRELEIIKLICQQYTVKEIADELCLSERTIETYKGMILDKMNVKNSIGMALFAIKNDIVSIDDIKIKTNF
jgi:DNA-binding NarL/FixJ family response regulator